MLRKYLDSYCNETFFGVHVELSDDSMLTMYALAEGKAVQQTTSFRLHYHARTVNHHLRQYIRWMRGAFIRTWWRFKYLPLNGYAYWSHFLGWLQMLITTLIFLSFFVRNPVVQKQTGAVLDSNSYSDRLRSGFEISNRQKSDPMRHLQSQLFTVSLSVLTTLWTFFVLRVVRWYSIVTCRRTGWITRDP